MGWVLHLWWPPPSSWFLLLQGATEEQQFFGPCRSRQAPDAPSTGLSAATAHSSCQVPEVWGLINPETFGSPDQEGRQEVGKISGPQTASLSHSIPTSHTCSLSSSCDLPYFASPSQVPDDPR